jgi:dipeptidyl aminopeptidase/acylaminoacyl peptidase
LDEKFVNTRMEGPSDMSAIEGLIDSLNKRELIDPNRVGISGFSRTVYTVGYTLTHSHYKFGAATLVDGIAGGYFDYLAWANTGGAEDDANVNGGRPFGERLQGWLKSSPGFNLNRVNTPVRIVALNKSSVLVMWEWFCGLFLQNKPVEFVEIPGGVHMLRNPSQRRIAMQGMVDWFGFWLKGDEDPDPSKADQYARWRELRKLQQQSQSNAPTN